MCVLVDTNTEEAPPGWTTVTVPVAEATLTPCGFRAPAVNVELTEPAAASSEVTTWFAVHVSLWAGARLDSGHERPLTGAPPV